MTVGDLLIAFPFASRSFLSLHSSNEKQSSPGSRALGEEVGDDRVSPDWSPAIAGGQLRETNGAEIAGSAQHVRSKHQRSRSHALRLFLI